MAESAGEQSPLPRVGFKMHSVAVPSPRKDDGARREEVRLLLVRLLIELYVDRHQELQKEVA